MHHASLYAVAKLSACRGRWRTSAGRGLALGLRALFPLWLLLAAGTRPAEAVDFIASETNCALNDPVRTTQNFGTGSNASGYRLEGSPCWRRPGRQLARTNSVS